MSSTIKPMKRNLPVLMFLVLTATWGLGQAATPSPSPAALAKAPTAQGPSPAAPTKPAGPVDDLKAVLVQMDKAGGTFKSAKANFEWVTYTKVVDEKDVQSGQIFFRHASNDMEVAVRVQEPYAKEVVIKDGRLSMYVPKTKQTAERDISGNRADMESVMNLGFGGRGQDLLKDYDVKMDGWETVDNVKTAKLELVPKGDHLKQFFSKVILWVDPKRDVPLKQQRLQSSGDYQLMHYTKIELNSNIQDDFFRLRTAAKK